MLKHMIYHLKSTIDQALNQHLVKKRWPSIRFSSTVIKELHDQLKQKLSNKSPDPFTLFPHEREVINQITQETNEKNRNNITRTKAYWDIYQEYPELHWAYLAHMVSRNGGWSMTDLKGELLPHLINLSKREHFFLFLETCNSYIFQDAYPQLLLYQESMKRNENFFHLLPAFHISDFMQPFWNHFWLYKNSQLLTVALIINEQNYIEKRVVQHPTFKSQVFDTIAFHAQSLLQLTPVFFPYEKVRRFGQHPIRLAGISVSDFTSLRERIEVGKRLYAILFGIEEVYRGSYRFADKVPHSGTRADFWPDMFSKQATSLPLAQVGSNRLVGCSIKKGAPKIYSPTLSNAWQDMELPAPDRFDWFADLTGLKHFIEIEIKKEFEMTKEFCSGLNKIELAVLASNNLLK